ncbi:heat shock protein HslJ [Salmonella enterica subsp. enterica serovar Heidelberg]|nr:heat shock protein HslJ [Salmonella enterica subsp. enterica serovar Heidelberg]
MKKIVTLVALSIIMTGCVSSGKVSVKREQLEHHRFVLESVNGKNGHRPGAQLWRGHDGIRQNVQSIHRRRKTV